MTLAQGFSFTPAPPVMHPNHFPFPPIASPLGPLLGLVGRWQGVGFNTIWRPNFPRVPQDRFLELDLTDETFEVDVIPGEIPNRGLAQADIVMFGVHYLQQISDARTNGGLHLEPGIWAVVPETSDPAQVPTVVRMASIPHGTTILAQGVASTINGAPAIPDNDIIPFGINGAPPPKFPFAQAENIFTELNLAVPSVFRSPSDASAQTPTGGGRIITQDMVRNPNKVLQDAIVGQNITSTTILQISTAPTPVPGGGTSNTDFLANPQNPADANAACNLVEATLWIETVEPQHRHPFLQLQYSQTVMLDFNNLRWPHVTVGTLQKRLPVIVPANTIDPAMPMDLISRSVSDTLPASNGNGRQPANGNGNG